MLAPDHSCHPPPGQFHSCEKEGASGAVLMNLMETMKCLTSFFPTLPSTMSVFSAFLEPSSSFSH